jgi:4-hydroxy-tetrahydrodipicolinate synthase
LQIATRNLRVMKKKFYGTGVALITPFKEDLSIDFQSLEKLLKYVSDNGVDYLVMLGTTGESSTLSQSEKVEIIKFIKANNPKKLPLVLGLGGNSTKELLDKLTEFDFNGIDAILSVSPYYNKPTQEGIYQHYTHFAASSPVPVVLYNIPGRTASNITADTTLRLAQNSKIIGIKEASGDFVQCIEIIKNKPADFFLTGGDDILTVPVMAIGGVGSISAISNAFPKVCSDMTNYALANEYGKANVELHKFSALNKLLFEEGNPVGVKTMLEIIGICKPFVRLPLMKGTDELRAKLTAGYKK